MWRDAEYIYGKNFLSRAQEVMLRRLKADVMAQLPPKRRQVVRLPPPDASHWPQHADGRAPGTLLLPQADTVSAIHKWPACKEGREGRTETYDVFQPPWADCFRVLAHTA